MKLILITLFLLLTSLCFAQGDPGKKTYKFFKNNKTTIQNPFEMRDPFRRPQRKRKSVKKDSFKSYLKGSTFTNIPDITEFSLDQIKIVGVMIGKERRAMAKVGSLSHIFILKEGMKLGKDEAEIKAILPGGVVLVEKIRNVYDQHEYLETIIPVSQ